MARLTVQLVNTAAGGSLARVSAQASFFAKGLDGGAVRTFALGETDGAGQVALELNGLIKERDVVVIALLDGTSTLGQVSVDGTTLPNETPIELAFEFAEATPGVPTAPEPDRPAFTYGRLLDRRGKVDMEGVQIVFYATRTALGPSEPFTSVSTEANGYFFLEYPEGEFVEVHAEVGLRLVANMLPVRLDQINLPSDPTSVFPTRIILVVDLESSEAVPSTPTAAEEDCGCGQLDMHSGKRVLEEYSFHTLVRTTEPEVRGFVLDDLPDITLGDLLKHHPIRAVELIDAVVQLPVFSGGPLRSRFGTSTTMASGTAVSAGDDLERSLKNVKLNRGAISAYLSQENAITPENIVGLLDLSETIGFREAIGPPAARPLGRVVLSNDNTVDWDNEPTLYQAVSVAHGHLLHFKSEWIADGYSLGDVLYSLPLAPGQKKQIVVFDWERRESAANVQSVEYEESLYNSLGRDRDIFEITRGAIEEHSRGRSSATTASASAGIGGFIGGALFGVSGGAGHSQSTASQDSLRKTSASDLQRIRDRITQSANSVRSQRSTVIQTVAQGERFEISSESVANYNHCHAITIQYFEVLRHFKVRQRFVEARECVFVPLLMSRFDLDKALRWRESLEPGLLDNRLRGAFEAANRVKSRWAESNFPTGTFASERILNASGAFKIRFVLRRPADKVIEADDTDRPIVVGGALVGYHKKKIEDIDAGAWASLQPFLGSTTPRDFYDRYLRNSTNKDEAFHRQLGQKIAEAFVQSLTFTVADETGAEIAAMNFDATLTSRYRREGVLNVTVRFAGRTTFGRDKISYVKIRSGPTNTLPDNSSVVIESGFIRYKSRHFEGFLCNFREINDDLVGSDSATLYAGPTAEELRDPRRDDVAMLNRLLDHLNDNLEPYHREIWRKLTSDRRFLLLDGIVMPPASKGAGRSLASLVENELIGIVGNSLVFPVARGLNLDPNFSLKESLSDYYRVSETEPISISVPTKGVYAEAMMGKCNSCEEKDETRFWRWEESPIPDSPTPILPIDTASRRADPGSLQPAPLANPIVNIQNAPGAPDPPGLGATHGLLGKSDVFGDITGLSQNQINALESLKASLEATKAFGQEAAKIETQKMMERRLDNALKAINSDPNLEPKQKAELAEKAVNAYLGAGATKPDEAVNARDEKTQNDISKHLERVNKGSSGQVSLTKPDGTQVSTKFNDGAKPEPLENRIGKGGVQPLRQANSMACWATVATMMVRWKDGQSYTVEDVLAKAGPRYVELYRDRKGLPYTDKQEFVSQLGMVGEPPASYSAVAYRDMLLGYGPLWVTVDADESAGFSAHALVVTAISADLGTLEVVDPVAGASKRMSFNEFSDAFSAVVTDGPSVPATQVVHFSSPEEPASEGGNPAKEVNEYDPGDPAAIIINMAEFTTGIAGIRNYKDWKTNAAIPHNKRKNGYRTPSTVLQLVLHESAADSGDGFDDSNNTTSHLGVQRDATIKQFNDLVEFENHAKGMNTSGVGIELVNRGWLSSKTSDGGEGIPAREADMTAAQKATYAEANGYIWTFWGDGFNIYKPPADLAQLEKEVELLTWLTDTLSATVDSAPTEFQNLFPTFDKTWLQLVSYDDVKDQWTFPAANVPTSADQATKNLFIMTTGYDVLQPAQIKGTRGIVSHNATYDGHSDGSFLSLYTWLRMEKGKSSQKALDLCTSLMKSNWFRVTPKRQPDKRVVILDVTDSNLV
ncbi:MAG: papain-like cysteine protease family protein [Solirubrobacteraceae bacterium]